MPPGPLTSRESCLIAVSRLTGDGSILISESDSAAGADASSSRAPFSARLALEREAERIIESAPSPRFATPASSASSRAASASIAIAEAEATLSADVVDDASSDSAAQKALRALNKTEVIEVASLSKPPPAVRSCLSLVQALLQAAEGPTERALALVERGGEPPWSELQLMTTKIDFIPRVLQIRPATLAMRPPLLSPLDER